MRAVLCKALRKLSKNRADYQKLKRSRHTEQGQHPVALAERTRRPKKAIKPTWPGSDDQRKQSRPIIVLHPLRSIARRMESKLYNLRGVGEHYPKWRLDAGAVRGQLL